MKKAMDLWQLHIFCKVIELEGFSRAGKAIHLTQPTVSSHIKDLENHFECRLIDRLGKKAVPTKAGELLYQYACKLIALRDETETAMARFQGMIKGRLIIGGSTIPGAYILPKIIGLFTKKYPDVSFSLTIGDTEKIIQDTIAGKLEVSIVGAKSFDKRICQKKMLDDELRLIVPVGHKWAERKSIQLEMLFREPFIMREHGSGTLRSIDLSFAKKGLNSNELNIVAEMGSTASLIQGIKENVGISISSIIAVAEEIKNGSLKAVPVENLELKREFYITKNKYRTPSPLCKEFIRFVNSHKFK